MAQAQPAKYEVYGGFVGMVQVQKAKYSVNGGFGGRICPDMLERKSHCEVCVWVNGGCWNGKG